MLCHSLGIKVPEDTAIMGEVLADGSYLPANNSPKTILELCLLCSFKRVFLSQDHRAGIMAARTAADGRRYDSVNIVFLGHFSELVEELRGL